MSAAVRFMFRELESKGKLDPFWLDACFPTGLNHALWRVSDGVCPLLLPPWAALPVFAARLAWRVLTFPARFAEDVWFHYLVIHDIKRRGRW